jgi:hypothetical protein
MRRVIGLLVLFCISVNLGCGDRGADMPKLGTVHGTVTLDGQTLIGVNVYFKPDVGRPSMGTTDAAGVYKAMYLVDEPGVKLGRCTVSVEWGPEEVATPIPAKYGAMSELTIDVKPGDNIFDIQMTSN